MTTADILCRIPAAAYHAMRSHLLAHLRDSPALCHHGIAGAKQPPASRTSTMGMSDLWPNPKEIP